VTALLLSLRSITKLYGTRTVVQDLSLDVAAGDSVAVLGPSGCGKTTVLRLIAGLERPDRGEIWIDGGQVASAGRNLVAAYERKVGLVFQDLALWPHLTVRDNLAFVVASAETAKDQRAARIDESLRICRVDPRLANRYPHELSGGEQQRVALARALVGTPRVLLLDEPFSNLDTDLRVVLRQELASLQRQLALTTIYVTHDPADAAALADRTVVMRDGTIESTSSTVANPRALRSESDANR
jgi:ABC-type Fe3+/spermidine/putrescine transport system ATPase subunit